jgi:hypothetical protein
LSAETEQWAIRLENRAKYLARLASAILFFVLCLAGAAVAVFFFAASITKSDLSASDIDAKLNASTNAITKLVKDQDAAAKAADVGAGEVAEKIKEVGEHLAGLPSSKVSLLHETDITQPATIDLANEPSTVDRLGQILISNLQNPSPDGSITRSLLFRGHFAVALRASIDSWQTFASNMRDFAPLVQALDAYLSAIKREQEIGDSRNLNEAAHRKLYDKKSDAIAGLLPQDTDRSHNSFFNRNECHAFWHSGNNHFSHFAVDVALPI